VSPDYAVVAQKSAPQETLSIFDQAFEKDYGLSLETLAARYDQQWINRSLNYEKELTGIRTESHQLGDLLAEARSELKQTQSELHQIKIELDESQTELSLNREDLHELRAKIDHVFVEIKGIREDRDLLAAELRGVYNSRSYRITAPLRAVFGTARAIRDRVRPDFRNEGIEPLVFRTVIRLRKVPVYVKTKNLLKKRLPGLWNAIRKVTLPSYSYNQPPALDLVSILEADQTFRLYQGVSQTEDEKHFVDLFQRELAARQKKLIEGKDEIIG
jgi:O-antigen chain-terminating methyltransferase